jgi:hypothetical protein
MYHRNLANLLHTFSVLVLKLIKSLLNVKYFAMAMALSGYELLCPRRNTRVSHKYGKYFFNFFKPSRYYDESELHFWKFYEHLMFCA